MSIGENIKKYRTLNNLGQEEFAQMLGVTRPAVSYLESGKREPRMEQLKKIAEILNIPIDILVSDVPTFSNTETYETSTDQIYRPILGTVKAGYDMYCDQNILGYKAVEKQKTKGSETFWLRVAGDSMNAVGILDGSLVNIKKEPVCNRQIAVVRINGDEATIKQVIFQGDNVILQPRSTNPAHEIKILSKKDFENGYAEIIGKVIDVSFEPNDMLR